MEVTGQLETIAAGRGVDQSFAARWDPRPKGEAPDFDAGWIGEDTGGVWLAVHPETALLDLPDVAAVYEHVRLHPELTAADRDTMSAGEYALASEYVAAFHRRLQAERGR